MRMFDRRVKEHKSFGYLQESNHARSMGQFLGLQPFHDIPMFPAARPRKETTAGAPVAKAVLAR